MCLDGNVKFILQSGVKLGKSFHLVNTGSPIRFDVPYFTCCMLFQVLQVFQVFQVFCS